MSEGRQTLSFQTEVQRLLHLMVHSLYSNKEVFLRELVSNASDACDKLRFEALRHDGLLAGDPELRIRVDCDRAQRTITIADNGIGMNRLEVIENLGTIARSGTREFLAGLTGEGAKDLSLIGQFGVGFYSAFVVSDRVTVLTRHAGAPAEEGVRWESNGEGEYTIEDAHREARGTEVILHLREGEDELLDAQRPPGAHPQVLRPHRAPRTDASRHVRRRHGRLRDGQSRVRVLAASEAGDQRRRVPRVLQARRPRFRRSTGLDASSRRGSPRMDRAPLHSGACTLRPVRIASSAAA
jgi:hypothetical protein